MFDESTLFNIIKQEISDRCGVETSDINLNSNLIEDLNLDDEDIDSIIATIQYAIRVGDDIIGSHEVRDCATVYDLLDVLLNV